MGAMFRMRHGCHRSQSLIGGHAGSTSLLELVNRRHPRARIHGHLHYWFGREGMHFDVASAGKKRAMMIDLETIEHRVIEDA